MSELFNIELKTALQTAHMIELAGETYKADEMYVEIIKSVAQYKKIDVMTYFYGNSVYSKISSFEDVVRYVFIAQCARDTYLAIESLGPTNGSNPWATISNNDSDEAVLEVFRWLALKGRNVEDEDFRYFKVLLKMAKAKNKINFQLSEKLKKMKLTEIISLVAKGERMITEGGEIR